MDAARERLNAVWAKQWDGLTPEARLFRWQEFIKRNHHTLNGRYLGQQIDGDLVPTRYRGEEEPVR